MYERQDGQGLEVGSYAHRPILHEPDEIPSIEEASLTPTELPFTQEDFELAARARTRARAGDPRRRVGRHQVRDQRPALAHTRRAAAARRDARGQGSLVGGRGVGEGRPGRRPRRCRVDDARRVGDRPPVVRHRALLRRAEDAGEHQGPARRRASTRRTGSSIRPSSGRRTAASASRRSTSRRSSSARCSTRRRRGSGRTGTSRTRSSSRSTACSAREHEWDARWWSPIINAEHLAMRDRAAMFDLTAFSIFDVEGPGALDVVQKVSARQMNVPSGRVIYTPVLTPSGGFKSDLTIMKMDDETVPRRHRRRARDGRQEVVRRPSARRRLGDDRRLDLDLVHRRALGPAGARHPLVAHGRRRLERGLSVQYVEERSTSTG